MDCGWDTSEDEGGMQIDLDGQNEDEEESSDKEDIIDDDKTQASDPSTGDCGPSETVKDPVSVSCSTEQSIDKNGLDACSVASLNIKCNSADDTPSNEENSTNGNSREGECHLLAKTVPSEYSDEENDRMLDTQIPHTGVSSSQGGENTCSEINSCASPNESPEQVDVQICNVSDSLVEEKNISRTNQCKSPSISSIHSEDNTQSSILGDTDLSDVNLVECDFGLEKEPAKEVEDDRLPCHKEDIQSKQEGNTSSDIEDSVSAGSEQRQYSSHEKEREKFRRQEEVNTRNEEVMVDLCRAESDSERIEEDVSQPVKKSKKKAASNKIKKKGKKLKKGHSKKIKNKQKSEVIVEDHRFVEIREDRLSVGSNEEGELYGDAANLDYRKSHGKEVSVNVYGQGEEARSQNEDEQLEPGEIIEVEKKQKSRGKKVKKKKKRRRHVATIEEGNQGEDGSQRFPTFLDWFFVQNEGGEEEFDDSLESVSRSFENEVRGVFQRGEKNYRRHHSSESEDSIKSHNGNLESRFWEPEQRRGRRHNENGHEARGRRRQESVNSREVIHEAEHHYGTPRDTDRGQEYDRERSRSERDRERVRNREGDATRGRGRKHERSKEVRVGRDKDRRRLDVGERRWHPTRSSSHEHRQRLATPERLHQTRSQGHSSRHRRRSKSRETSDRERDRERSMHSRQNRSSEIEPARRVILSSHSQIQSPHLRNERTGSDKENRAGSHRRRHKQTREVSDQNNRVNGHHRNRREMRGRERSKSSSLPSTVSSDHAVRHRNSHRRIVISHISSDEDDSSDVILVETETVVINLDDDDDVPPPRVQETRISPDVSAMLVDVQSIAPPSEPQRNPSSSAVIQSNHDIPEVEDISESEEQEGVATPTRDELAEEVQNQQLNNLILESDYDPAHPTEEAEELEIRSPASNSDLSPVPIHPPAEETPAPLVHSPPPEVRPSSPIVPPLIETSTIISQAQHPSYFGSPSPQLTFVSQFQEQMPPPPMQHLASLQPFPGCSTDELGPAQRFPSMLHVNGPSSSNLQLNNCLLSAFPAARGLMPISDNRPHFPLENSRLPLPFGSSLPHLPRPPIPMESLLQPPPPRRVLPQQMNVAQHQVPISAMAPLAQLTSLLPALDVSKMAAHRADQGLFQPLQMFRPPLPMVPLQSSLPEKNSLCSSVPNMSSGSLRSFGGRFLGGDHLESTEVVDMDMSPREDDYGLEFLSPNSISGGKDKRKRNRKPHSRTIHTSSSVDNNKPGSGTGKSIAHPALHVETLSKGLNKLTSKGRMHSSNLSKAKTVKKKRTDNSDDDMPTSAVDLTNKEKYLKKLHFQERVIDEVKMAIKPFYNSKKITKEQYKLILRKAVPKVCHNKSGNINPQKILHLVEAYVRLIMKGRGVGSSGKTKKKKQHTESHKDTVASSSLRQNGERVKNVTR